MIKMFSKLFSRNKIAAPVIKKIAFIDGDQSLPGIINAYHQYLVGTETHLIRMRTVAEDGSFHNEPKSIN